MSELPPGTKVHQYTVESVLGQGGMAVVYAVRHQTLGAAFALKMVRAGSADVARRLLVEGRAQGALRHPNVVAVTDTIVFEGQLGLVMELVEGPTLEALLARRRLELPEADALARGILDGVGAAHARELVHRDLKPGNVLLAPVGSALVPKIADFGLAKVLGEGGPNATRTGVGMGTPPYMAPEQIRDAASTDARADVFSLGAILHELVSGVRAFDGPDTWEIFSAIQAGRFAPLPDEVPERMRDAIRGALVVDRTHRLPSVAALAAVWSAGTPAATVEWDEDTLAFARRWTRAAAPAASGGTWSGGSAPAATWDGAPAASSPAATWDGAPGTSAPSVPSEAPPSLPPPSATPSSIAGGVGGWLAGGAVAAVGVGLLAVRLTAETPAPAWPTLRQLTFESGHLHHPTLAPDGEELVYAVEGELFLRRLSGDRPLPLTAEVAVAVRSPAFSPDGARLAVTTDAGIAVMAADGGSPRRVADRGALPAWSPDGRRLAFVDAALEDPVVDAAAGSVWVVELDGSGLREVAPGVGARGVGFSPDGERLVYWTADRDLATIALAGGSPVPLTRTPEAEWAVAWVGHEVWFLSDRAGGVNLWALPVGADGAPSGVPRALTRGALGSVWSFSVSSDGRRVAFDVVDIATSLWRVPLVDGAFGPPTRLFRSRRRFGSLGRGSDGTLVADTPGWLEDLVVLSPSGTVSPLVEDPLRARSPALSPDGTRLLFRRDDGLALARADGSGLVRLADPVGRGLVWSPDGTRFVASDRVSVELAADGVPTGRTWRGEVADWGPAGLLVGSDVVDAASGAVVRSLPGPASAWAGTQVLVADGATLRLDGVGEPILDVSPGQFPHGRFVVVGPEGASVLSDDETSNLWLLALP